MPDDTYELMLEELTPLAQTRVLEFLGLQKPEDGNFDVVPIATLPRPE